MKPLECIYTIMSSIVNFLMKTDYAFSWKMFITQKCLLYVCFPLQLYLQRPYYCKISLKTEITSRLFIGDKLHRNHIKIFYWSQSELKLH